MFRGFGVDVDIETVNVSSTAISIDGPTQLRAGDITIPGDISSAAYFITAATLLPDSELVIENVGLNPTRAEFLNVLRSAGANLTTSDLRDERNEPVGTVTVRGGFSPTHGRVKLAGSVIPSLIDELPLLAVMGTQFNGGIEISNASELRHKETDRLKATAHNLKAMGAEVEETEDGLIIGGPTKLQGARIESFGDHRIAMAFSVAGLVAAGSTEISGAECVRISFPEFYHLLDQIVED
jgi:3-phosphoshikimate 1-carboxyvinyltransferase